MAAKTFKIGLSTTDKQNMAQDIYEQVEQLLFAEYDSSETYNTGDFVVYSNVLYRCKEDNVTGNWNSAKWEQATLQDLVDSVNGAVASVTGKANTADLLDGVLVPSQALSAKAINPVSSESGTFQTTPFILQGTGTANGTDSVDTSNVGKHVEKHGNSVVVNQLVQNGNFATTDNWVAYRGTFTVANNIASFTATQINASLYQDFPRIVGHKYLFIFNAKLTTASNDIYAGLQGSIVANIRFDNTTNWQTKYYLGTALETSDDFIRVGACVDRRESGFDVIQVKNVQCIDITQWFNGDIPQDLLDHPENAGRYGLLNIAYNTGTLTNSNGRYLECGGRNQFDGELEGGYIDNDTGQPYVQNNGFRSKNFVKVIVGETYHLSRSSTIAGTSAIFEYDENYNYIKNTAVITSDGLSGTITLTNNTQYVKYGSYLSGSGWGTNPPSQDQAQIVLSLYYTPEQGGEGYSEYYPYEEPKVYDTGTETLRSAGSVKDIKLPSGEITRYAGSYTFTGSESVGVFSEEYFVYYITISGMSTETGAKILSNIYPQDTQHGIGASQDDKSIITYSGRIYIKDSSCATSDALKTKIANSVLNYQLATPTTEQGTPFSENIEINDYGTMGWKSNATDFVDIPQGCKIFYPADYVLLIDTLNGYVSGSIENLALKTDIPTAIANYFASITGYDNTKTQTLKQVEGTLTWVDD